jgi:hypothetical protein
MFCNSSFQLDTPFPPGKSCVFRLKFPFTADTHHVCYTVTYFLSIVSDNQTLVFVNNVMLTVVRAFACPPLRQAKVTELLLAATCDVVAARVEFDHILALRASLPALALYHANEVFNILVFGAKSIMVFTLTRGAGFCRTPETGGDVRGDLLRSNPRRAVGVTAIGPIGGI